MTLPDFVPWHKNPQQEDIDIVFPEEDAYLIIPIEIDGTEGAMVMQATTRSNENVLYWDIDGNFLGTTERIHEMVVNPKAGEHILTVTDSKGSSKKRKFIIVESAD